MNILVVTDNKYIFSKFMEVISTKFDGIISFDFAHSPESKGMFELYDNIKVIDVKKDYKDIIEKYDLVISCHCKKIFPSELVNRVRCVNIHPGLNPYNRGWYPQVFAINNKMPHGATIHLMDEKVDHGAILIQKELEIFSYDTSLSVYERVVDLEIELFKDNFENVIFGTSTPKEMESEGNYNGIADFNRLCGLDLNNVATLKEHIDLLRSLSHGSYKNAYFIDEKGLKIAVSVNLEIVKN
jgi:methionyl-tRNA formyltransferase